MVARSLLAHRLRHSTIRLPPSTLQRARLSTQPHPPKSTSSATSEPSTESKKSSPPPQSWLTQKVKENPTAMKAFLGFTKLLGYGSSKQLAARRAGVMYTDLCVPRPGEEREFWQNECHLPPTFQSWFSVTNLHIWLLTVRLRALPDPHGRNHIQGLIDHFFLDVEERVRAVLQPKNAPPTSSPPVSATPTPSGPSQKSNFYTIANGNDSRPKGNAPERLVTRQMKILREQWAGLGMSMDYALIKGDSEMAAAVWRNFLGGRGARGIVYPSSITPSDPSSPQQHFRRSVNLVGGEVESIKKLDQKGLEQEEGRDDGSGIHDYPPNEADKYVKYPELMEAVVIYVRRELKRLEELTDREVMGSMAISKEGEGLEKLKFGKIRE